MLKIPSGKIKDNRLILKSQQRFRSEKYNVFTEEVNKIALIAHDDKRIQSIDSTENICISNKWKK